MRQDRKRADWYFLATAMGLALLVGFGCARAQSTPGRVAILVSLGLPLAAAAIASYAGRSRVLDLQRGSEGGDPLGRFAFTCLAVGVPLSVCNGLRLTKNITLGDPLLVFAGAALAFRWLRAGHLRGLTPRWLPLAAGSLLAAGLLAVFRTGLGSNLGPTLQFAGVLGVMPLIILLAADNPRRITLLIEGWVLVVVASCLAGIADLALKLGLDRALAGAEYVVTHRAAGLTVHPNHLGITAAMAVPAVIALASRGNRGGSLSGLSARHCCYAVILIIGVLVSGSRAAVLGLGAGLVITPLLQTRRQRSPVAFGLVIAVLGALAFVALEPTYASRLGLVIGERLSGDTTATASDMARTQIHESALRETLTHPFVGQGFSVVRDAHDVYLQLAQAGGLLALAAFASFAIGVLAAALRLARDSRIPLTMSNLAPALGASFIVWLSSGLVSNELYDRYLYIPVGVLLAIRALAIRTRARAAAAPAPRFEDSDEKAQAPAELVGA